MNKLRKEFLNNFIGLSSINILNLLIPLITMPLLSRHLGSAGYGYVLLFSSVTIFMVIVIDYSVNINGVRDVAKGNSENQSLYQRYQAIRLFFCLISTPFLYLYCLYNINIVNPLVLFELTIVSAVGYYLMAPWFHQGTSSLLIFSAITISIRVLQILLIIIFIKSSSDLIFVLRLNSYFFFLSGVILYLYRKKSFGVKEKLINKNIVQDIKDGFNNFIGDFSPNLYSNLPPLVLGSLVNPHIFACYSLAMRLINVAGSFQSILCKSIYPIAAKKKINVKSFLIFNITVSFIPILILLLYSDELVFLLLGHGYEDTIEYLNVSCIGIFLFSISSSLMFSFFLPNHLDGLFKKISVISSVMPAIIGYPLIFQMGAEGAIFMFIFARACFAFLYLFHYGIQKKNYE